MTSRKWQLGSLAILLVSIVLLLCPARVASAESVDVPGQLKFVIIVSRHGVRSPTGTVEQLNTYSSQPWPQWDVPPGHLTARGAALMSLFGGYYRSYLSQQGLFNASGCADAAHVSFYSDSDQRTVETGKSLAAGMFPGCAPKEKSEQHALREGEADPLFHSLAAGLGQPEHNRAVASIAGRIGNDPDGLTEAYRPELLRLQQILAACPDATACPQPEKMLLSIPATLDGGKGDHLAELKGPLNTASTITENFLLEYANGLPMEQVGWGRVDLQTLKQLMNLHTAASDLTRRTRYLATVQASNALEHIRDTFEQAVTGKPVAGALGKPTDRAVVLTGHDTNLANIAGALNLDWLVDGRRDDTPPGGAIVFELRQRGTAWEVNTYYVAQTLEQMRNLTPLTLEKPPVRANLFIPGCSTSDESYSCGWKAFKETMNTVIDPSFTESKRP
jgi:4-phytase/acid phosphatase